MTTDSDLAPTRSPLADGAPLLAVDASTYVGTVAVVRDGIVVATRETAMRGEREERLLPAVAAALDEARVAPNALGAVVCGAGPGSFTSLRIAGAIAKGLATAAGCALHAVPSLALVAAGAAPALHGGVYLVTLDAMRGERFAALVTLADERPGVPPEVTAYEYLGLLAAADVAERAHAFGATWLAGGGDDAGATAHHPPHARGVRALARWLADAGPVDLDAWEPDYGRAAEAQVKWEATHGRPLPRTMEVA